MYLLICSLLQSPISKWFILSLLSVRKISLQAFDRTLKNMHASRLWQFVNHLQLNSIAHKLRTSFCNFLLTAPLFSTLLQLPTVEEIQTNTWLYEKEVYVRVSRGRIGSGVCLPRRLKFPQIWNSHSHSGVSISSWPMVSAVKKKWNALPGRQNW